MGFGLGLVLGLGLGLGFVPRSGSSGALAPAGVGTWLGAPPGTYAPPLVNGSTLTPAFGGALPPLEAEAAPGR